MQNDNPIIRLVNISKNYRNKQVLRGISLNFNAGNVVGLIGKNGSGKTTLLKIILGLITNYNGHVRKFDSEDEKTPTYAIGACLEKPGFFPDLSVDSNLKITSTIKDAPNDEIQDFLQRFQLLGYSHEKVKNLSTGMTQRLNIISALLGNPSIIILDEPDNGLDPDGIILLRNIIKGHASKNKLIIIASHSLTEIEKLSSHIAYIEKGELLFFHKTTEIIECYGGVEKAYQAFN